MTSRTCCSGLGTKVLLCLLVGVLAICLSTGCPSNPAESGADASVIDGTLIDGDIPDGTGPTDGDVDAPVGCTFDIPLDQSCTRDCDCEQGLACRGFPGEEVCSVPCMEYSECDTAPLSCTNKVCDMNIAACRCYCEQGGCLPDICYAGHCVTCVDDVDCAGLQCSATPGEDTPRCRLDTDTCVCAGQCGDGVCDEIEEAMNSCPEECTGGCTDGEVLPYSCTDGEEVEWCVCTGGTWVCNDPWPQCFGDTDCQKMGGMCVATAQDCFEGTVDASPLGCVTPSPLCCKPDNCVGPGMSYPPMSNFCCPGLTAMPSLMLMDPMYPDLTGVACFASCWQQICAPCGDGNCQLHLGENFCACPEDCPPPPYPLVCYDVAADCGRQFCRQQGTVCHQETPRCEQRQCQWDVEDLADHLCNPVTHTCEAI